MGHTIQIIIVIDKLFDYSIVQHCMLKKLLSCGVILLLLSVAGCGQKQIMLMNARLDTGDKVPLPPTDEELLTSKSFVAFLRAICRKSFPLPQSSECEFCAVCSGGVW